MMTFGNTKQNANNAKMYTWTWMEVDDATAVHQ